MRAFRISHFIVWLWAALFLTSCSHQRPKEGRASSPPVLGSSIPTRLTSDGAALVESYRTANTFADKLPIIYSFNELDPQEALAGLAILFRVETNSELKSEILTAVSQAEGSNAVAVAALGLEAAQPRQVRLAAIQALRMLDNPAAVPILQRFSTDPSVEIREKTQEAIEAIQTPHLFTR